MPKKIAITNEKGGCGKTTTAVNLSAILAEKGYRVLLIDADPQSYATMYYDLYDPALPSLYELMLQSIPVQEAIASTKFTARLRTERFSFDVLRANSKLKDLEEELTVRKLNNQPYQRLMVNALLPIDSEYDFIIIDCPPQGYKLLDTIQCYADFVLMPMIPDEFALHSLRIKAASLVEIRRTLNPKLRLLGGLIVMDEKNQTKAAYRNALQSQSVIPFFRATVRKNIALSRAINAHEPINVYAKRSNGNIDYQAVTEELIGRVK